MTQAHWTPTSSSTSTTSNVQATVTYNIFKSGGNFRHPATQVSSNSGSAEILVTQDQAALQRMQNGEAN
jgi:hypothetical protein